MPSMSSKIDHTLSIEDDANSSRFFERFGFSGQGHLQQCGMSAKVPHSWQEAPSFTKSQGAGKSAMPVVYGNANTTLTTESLQHDRMKRGTRALRMEIDLGDRLSDLEERMTQTLVAVGERLDSLEKLFLVVNTGKNKMCADASLSWEDPTPTLASHASKGSSLGLMRDGARICDVQKIAMGLNDFALEALPFYRELGLFQQKLHKCIRICCFMFLFLGFAVFVTWGFMKFCKPVDGQNGGISDYVEVQHEAKLWAQRTSVPCPRILCISDLPAGLDVVASFNEIPSGIHSAKRKTILPLVNRDVIVRSGVARSAKCLASRPPIQGFYGDPFYKYIAFEILAPLNLSAQGFRAALILEAQIGGLFTANESLFYTFSHQVWTGVEVFLKRLVNIKGDALGLSRLIPRTYAEWFGQDDLMISEHYMRLQETIINGHKQEVAKFYIRASSVEQEDSYQPYSFLKLLEDSGGLWTSSASLVGAYLLLCFCICGAVDKVKNTMLHTTHTLTDTSPNRNLSELDPCEEIDLADTEFDAPECQELPRPLRPCIKPQASSLSQAGPEAPETMQAPRFLTMSSSSTDT